jgi:hypothetical protein
VTLVRAVLIGTVLATLALLIACGGGDDDGGEGSAEPPFPVRGILIEVDASDDRELEGITLRDDGGNEWTFAVLLDNPASVTADHLEQHIDLDQPVLVYFRGEGDNRQAYQIDDAPP